MSGVQRCTPFRPDQRPTTMTGAPTTTSRSEGGASVGVPSPSSGCDRGVSETACKTIQPGAMLIGGFFCFLYGKEEVTPSGEDSFFFFFFGFL